MNGKSFLFEKVFAPKAMVIDKPGVIYNVVSRKYGSLCSKKRIVFHFEKSIISLHKQTIASIGAEKSSKLFYKIGKEAGMRYMLMGGYKKIPFNDRKNVLNYVFNSLRSGGMSFARSIEYNNGDIIFKGNQNIVCRETKESDFFKGIVSGILSYIFEENIEAKSKCRCPDECVIIASNKFPKKHVPKIEELRLETNYLSTNFKIGRSIKGYPSFNDFVRFRKIFLDNHQKFHFYNQTISPVEPSLLEIYSKNYLPEYEDTFNKGVIKGAEEIANDLNLRSINDLKKILSSLGWGIFYKIDREEKSILLINAPITKFGFLFHSLIINGFLNFILGKELKLKLIRYSGNNIKIYYIE